MNNEYAKEKQSDSRFDLKNKLCFKKYNDQSKQNYKWTFYKPWETITEDSKAKLNTIIISFKQNLRVINKTVNWYEHWKKDIDGKAIEKEFIKQTKGESWAIRKPLHVKQ